MATPMPLKTKVLVSGASIAGPALAYWLDHYGFAVTVVEIAREVRKGGQAVDFKGATHRTVLMKLMDHFATDIKLDDYAKNT